MTTVESFDRDDGVVRVQHSRRSDGTRAVHERRTKMYYTMRSRVADAVIDGSIWCFSYKRRK